MAAGDRVVAPAALTAGTWRVEPGSGSATFGARGMGRPVRGRVPVLEGTVEVGRDGTPIAVHGRLDLGALDTGHPRRDRDLRAPRLLDLDRHPVMTFTADSVHVAPGGWQVAGRLAARGAEAPVTGVVVLSASTAGAATLSATTRLERRALGVRAPRFMIGRFVDITVTATVRRAG
jgi:polyisoprenoid-binding protein YceI